MRIFKSGLILLGAVVLFISGCASTPLTANHSTQTDFMKAFKFTEITETGESLPIYERSIVPVDINSIIRVKVNQEDFPIGEIGAPGLLGDDILKQRESLIEILAKLNEYIVLAKEFQKLYTETHDTMGNELNEKRALINQREEIRGKRNNAAIFVITAVREYVKLTKFVGQPTPSASEITAWLVKNKAAKIVDGNFTKFVKNEIKMMEDETHKRKDILAKSAEIAQLRLTASLYPKDGAKVYLHLPGYDRLESGTPNFIDRMSIVLDEKGKEELRKEVAFSAKFATAYNNARKDGSDIMVLLSKQVGELKNTAKTIISSLNEKSPKLSIDDVKGFLKRLSVKYTQNEQKKTIDALNKEIELLNTNLNDLKNNISKLKQFSYTPDMSAEQILVDLPQDKLAELKGFFDIIVKLFDENNNDSFQKVLIRISDLLKHDALIKADFEKEFEDILEEDMRSVTDMSMIIARIKEQIESIYNVVKDVLDAAPVALVTQGPPMTVDIPITDVQDTEIQITKTARREGDMVEFEAKLLSKNGTDVKGEGSKDFKVLKFGLHSKVSGNVIFVDRNSSPTNFVAAPAVSYMVHYRSREKDKCGVTWNAFDPSIGLSTTLLNFQGAGTEVGIGLALSFFNDLVQVGYGYNLQVSERHEYFFIGIGIYEMFDAIRGKQ